MSAVVAVSARLLNCTNTLASELGRLTEVVVCVSSGLVVFTSNGSCEADMFACSTGNIHDEISAIVALRGMHPHLSVVESCPILNSKTIRTVVSGWQHSCSFVSVYHASSLSFAIVKLRLPYRCLMVHSRQSSVAKLCKLTSTLPDAAVTLMLMVVAVTVTGAATYAASSSRAVLTRPLTVVFGFTSVSTVTFAAAAIAGGTATAGVPSGVVSGLLSGAAACESDRCALTCAKGEGYSGCMQA